MKIAQIAPLIERVPPKKYGGTERVIHDLTEELVRRGHDVTLFASGDSETSAKLVSVYPKALREVKMKDIYGSNIWGLLNIGIAYQLQEEFDVIHDHNWYLSLPTANLSQTPTVMTLHGPLTNENRSTFEAMDNINYVSISKSQTFGAPNLNYTGTVYNGLNMDHYPVSKKDGGYLLFVGRIAREKGVHIAIEMAQKLNLPLIIAAKVDKIIPEDVRYFNQLIKPKLSDQIRWIGEIEEEERNELMSKALCFLHPVTWREPFGLTLIESMACGAPVVAFNLGSIPEIITEGKTGFIVSTKDEMLQAIKNIKKIDRLECSRITKEKFSARNMAKGYEEVYAKVMAKKQHDSVVDQDSTKIFISNGYSNAIYAHQISISSKLKPKFKKGADRA
jgi:glycosyltransferase involved in cell wall biosynthesis